MKIVPFKNPSGLFAYRVTGMIRGGRVQKNFSTYQKAEGYMIEQLAGGGQGDSTPVRTTTTVLSADDLKEAELAWSRLRKSHPEGSLVTAVDYYLEHAGQVILDGPADEVLGKYLDRRTKRGNQDNTVANAGTILRKFLREAGITYISDCNQKRATAWIFADGIGEVTRRDRRSQLHNFCEFLIKEKYLSKNFVEDIDTPKVSHDGKVTTITPEQVLKLLQIAATAPVGRKQVKGAMLPYFACCALSGTRPDEAKRLESDWKWFSKENRVITGFRSKFSKKSRTIEISPELVQILEYCRQLGYAPSIYSEKAFDKIREEAGVFAQWDNDILRHTYASHHYACKRDMKWLEKNMGNSEGVLLQSYLDQTIVEATGRKLFEITLDAIVPENVRASMIRDAGSHAYAFHGGPTSLSYDQALKLLQVAAVETVGKVKPVKAGMLPYFAVCLLAGLESKEAKRLGPGRKWLDRENLLIKVPKSDEPEQPVVEGKPVQELEMKEAEIERVVPIHPKLVEILEFCRKQNLYPSQYVDWGFKKVRSKAGLANVWDNGILRRTFASHHYAWRNDIEWLAKYLRVSAFGLKKSTLDQSVPSDAGERFFETSLEKILPSQQAANIV
ncbi:MAG: hypothetical protein WCA95_03580 [Opitutaceae bacterium]